MRYNTLQYVTWRYIAFHYTYSMYILHCILNTLEYLAICYHALHCYNALEYMTLDYMTLHCITSHCITINYVQVHIQLDYIIYICAPRTKSLVRSLLTYTWVVTNDYHVLWGLQSCSVRQGQTRTCREPPTTKRAPINTTWWFQCPFNGDIFIGDLFDPH